MDNNNKILKELQEIAPALASLSKQNLYTIDPAYFRSLPEDIIKKTRSEPGLHVNLPKLIPYNVPSDYFHDLPAIILQRIAKEQSKRQVFEELDQISPILNTINKKHVYSVPSNYFDEMQWNKVMVTGEQTRVVSFKTKRTFVRSAVAAVFIGVLCLGLLIFKGNQKLNMTAAERSKPAFGVQKLTEQEIITFLKTTSPADNVVSTATSAKPTDNNIRISVSKIPDQEIQQFLKENGEM